MTDDIKAIRDALAAGPTPGEWHAKRDGVTGQGNPHSYRIILSMNVRDDQRITDTAYIAACHPERIARLLDALEQASKDADRYRYLRDRVPAEVLGQVKSAAGCWIDGEDDEGVLILLTGSDADAAIDAALKRGA